MAGRTRSRPAGQVPTSCQDRSTAPAFDHGQDMYGGDAVGRRMGTEAELGDDAEVAVAAPAQRPEQVGRVVCGDVESLAVRRDERAPVGLSQVSP